MWARRLVPSSMAWNNGGRGWGAADTIVAATFGLVALIAAVFVFLCIQGYGSTLAVAESRAQRAAQAVAEGSHWTIAATTASLDVAAAQLINGAPIEDVAAAFNL